MIFISNFRRTSVTPLFRISGEVRDSTSTEVIISVNRSKYRYQLDGGKFDAIVHLTRRENSVEIHTNTLSKIRRETVLFEQVKSPKKVKLVYVLCSEENKPIDGSFQAPNEEDSSLISALSRISVAGLLVQYVYSLTLPKRNTFNLELNEDNEPEVHVHILSEDRRELFAADQNQLWSIVARSLMNSKIFDVNSKFLAILSFTRYTFQSTVDPDQMTHQEMTNSIKGLASLGGGGLALVSSQCLYTWPESVHEIMDCFTNCDIVDRTKFMDDSCNRRTRGGCFATTLGSCVHELGHTFDLGHSNIGFMSTGFNRIDELFTNVHSCRKVKWWNTSSALILTQHKWLNASYEDRKVTYPIILMDNDIVKSNFGMTVIEYRERANSNIISYDSFTLPKKIVKLRCFNVNVIIMDVLGNILRLD